MMTSNNSILGRQRKLRRTEAAKHLNTEWGLPMAAATLAKLAVVGGGPPFYKAGRIPLYDVADLDAWVIAKLGRKRSSTSEHKRQSEK